MKSPHEKFLRTPLLDNELLIEQLIIFFAQKRTVLDSFVLAPDINKMNWRLVQK